MDLHVTVDEYYNKAFRIRNKLISSKIQKQILKNNNTFKTLHAGERCFILGNGPSLKKDDLRQLRGEIVFTVNQAYRNPDFQYISPQYHFWVDRNFFDVDFSRQEDLELLDCMKNCAHSSEHISCFYPIEQYEFVKQNGLLIDGKTFFLNPILHMGKIKNFSEDISSLTYSFGTVVQNAIVVAIYMGFTKIYILGCDSTGIINTLNASLKTVNDEYGYNVSENEKLRMEKMVSKSRVTDYAYSYYMTMKGFSYLYKVCSAKGISLVNCSATTVLDMIPRASLMDVLREGELV